MKEDERISYRDKELELKDLLNMRVLLHDKINEILDKTSPK